MRNWAQALGCLSLILTVTGSLHAQGTYVSSGGPVNQSMGGASVAGPIDAIGASYWNPATASGLAPEFGVGVGLLLPVVEASSSFAGFSGSTSPEPGVTALPTVGWVHRLDESRLTWVFGMHAVAGFRSNYPASTTNPIFFPQSNTPGVPGGFGRLYTSAEFLQIAPALSYAMTDNLAISFGPTLTLGELVLDPLVSSPPNDADSSGQPRYSSGRGTRTHWGGGFQLGLYYDGDGDWNYGFSIKSPQWFEKFRFHTENEVGAPTVGMANLDLPMIISAGVAYKGIANTLVAFDMRYFDYKNTDGFGPHGFKADGSLNGLGMSSVMALALGVQHQLTDTLRVRMGYTFNPSPFQDAEAIYAVAAALYYEHQFHAGFSKTISDGISLDVAYSYWLENGLSGPIVTAGGILPGSSVTVKESVHVASAGFSVRY